MRSDGRKMGRTASLISLASVTATLVINLLLSAFVQYLLEVLNDLSFMMILAVIAIDVQGVTRDF